MSPCRLRVAPVALAAFAVLAVGWGPGAATGGLAFDLAPTAESVTSMRLDAPSMASAGQERVDAGAERLATVRWAPLAVAAALVAAVEAVRRRYRHRGDVVIRRVRCPSGAVGRAPPLLQVTAN